MCWGKNVYSKYIIYISSWMETFKFAQKLCVNFFSLESIVPIFWTWKIVLAYYEIKRRLLLGRKVMTNLDNILKSRDVTLPTKVCLVKAMVFPVVIYGCDSQNIKKADSKGTDAFEQWCWRRVRVPWTARRSNQSILKEVSPKYSLEGLILKLKLQYFGCEELTHWKRPWCWENLKAGGEGDDRGWDGWMASLMDMRLSKLR